LLNGRQTKNIEPKKQFLLGGPPKTKDNNNCSIVNDKKENDSLSSPSSSLIGDSLQNNKIEMQDDNKDNKFASIFPI
jgi:hypothetical protein